MKTAVKTTVGVLAAEALASCLEKAEKYETAVKQHKDPEDLHQMRVQLRRLRTAMQVFAPSLRLPPAAQERQVAKVAQRLGKLRDLDVIIAKLQDTFAPDLPELERQKLDRVIAALTKRQKRAHKQVKKELKGDRYTTLKSKLYEWTTSPDCHATARLSIQAVLPDLMLPSMSQLWLHPGWLVGTKVTQKSFKPDTRMSADLVDVIVADQRDTLHSLRKQVKRVRYQLKFVSEYYGDRLNADLQRFADLQDVLGELQDSLVLADHLAKRLPGWQTQLPTLESLLTASRHRAWQQWQTHQAYFLQPENRAALRQVLLQPGVEASQPPAKKTTHNRTASKTTAKRTGKSTGSKTKASQNNNDGAARKAKRTRATKATKPQTNHPASAKDSKTNDNGAA